MLVLCQEGEETTVFSHSQERNVETNTALLRFSSNAASATKLCGTRSLTSDHTNSIAFLERFLSLIHARASEHEQIQSPNCKRKAESILSPSKSVSKRLTFCKFLPKLRNFLPQ